LKLRYFKRLAINRAKSKAIITARRVSEGFWGLAAEKPKLNPSPTLWAASSGKAQLQKFSFEVTTEDCERRHTIFVEIHDVVLQRILPKYRKSFVQNSLHRQTGQTVAAETS